ncbi:NADPH:quinone reductase-like Zn-dependent oxidoreductase [Breoghania corrubedonensis]|uniref:NADPH:quinone reductase-like Zn-dependent oxidoreductase n=1 Tax=Breoghania corrubedonensis TaxID=665038 RepID=A0A2T5V8M6_9HYPH|nr:zinc-dependent alcohol dehydrogenase family protein [Breoghania corrubedonensis]PTW60084.1 NADPH:quinone reductase-like Zn-dependent oxidoreductase [Breoghania corrubedonensis]
MKNQALIYRAFGDPLDVLRLETAELAPRAPGTLRVEMALVPVNPSDLIPVTGAYSHLITPPMVAGYEGVGRIVEADDTALVGRRVLPLRGPGTWQRHVDCDSILAVPVPDDIDDATAARAYINPMAALRMLTRWPVRDKRVLLTAAGSSCATLLGHWALGQGAREVIGLYRSEARVERMRALAITPLHEGDAGAVTEAARKADVTFDAVGGRLGSLILNAMGDGSVFAGYGLMSGAPVTPDGFPRAAFERFHLRDDLAVMSAADWQGEFDRLWPLLRQVAFPKAEVFPLERWREAVAAFHVPGAAKPLIDFRAG